MWHIAFCGIFIATMLFYIVTVLKYEYVPLYIANVFSGLFFYSMGTQSRNIMNKLGVGIIALLVYLCFIIFGVSGVDMRTNEVRIGSYYTWWLFALSGCFSSLFLIKCLPERIISSKFNIIAFVGKKA